MSLFGSVFLGMEGTYHINGIKIEFKENNTPVKRVFGESWFGYSVSCLLNNSAFKILSFTYLHLFVHEMGHSLAGQMMGRCKPEICIDTLSGTGCAYVGGNSSIIDLAGPLAGITLEVAKLVGAVSLAVLLPTPIGLPLGLFLGFGASFLLFGELMYAFIAQGGDWTSIASNGTLDLVLSYLIIFGVITAGCCAVIAIL